LKFEDLAGKPYIFEYKGQKLEIPPLNVEDFDLFLDLTDSSTTKDQLEVFKKIFIKTMMAMFPDKTEEDIKKLPLHVMLDFVEPILRANKLEEVVEEGDAEGFRARLMEQAQALQAEKNKKRK